MKTIKFYFNLLNCASIEIIGRVKICICDSQNVTMLSFFYAAFVNLIGINHCNDKACKEHAKMRTEVSLTLYSTYL